VNRTTRAALGTPGSPGAARHASESGTKGNTAVASLDPDYSRDTARDGGIGSRALGQAA
jgi:hypothetical protein